MIRPDNNERIQADFDYGHGTYYVNIAHVKFVRVEISHREFNPAKRTVQLISTHTTVLFTLFQEGDPIAYVGEGENWYIPRPDTIGFLANLSDTADSDRVKKKKKKGRESPKPPENPLDRISTSIGMEPERIRIIGGGMGEDMYWCVLALTGVQAKEKGKVLAALRRNPMIAAAGPVYYLTNFPHTGESMGIFTNYISLVFPPDATAGEITRFVEERGLKLVHYINSGNTYVAGAGPEVADEINDIVREIRASGRVIYASVEIAGTVGMDQSD